MYETPIHDFVNHSMPRNKISTRKFSHNIVLFFRLYIILYDCFQQISVFQYFRYIEIGIKQCRSSGIDCKVHGLTILGRLRSDEDDAAANFSFLASDREEEEDEKVVSSSLKKKKKSATKEIQTNVFCWGLNDKDQLGGPKGSKVSFFYSRLKNITFLCFLRFDLIKTFIVQLFYFYVNIIFDSRLSNCLADKTSNSK